LPTEKEVQMFCPHCGNRVEASDPYCGYCGAQQPLAEPIDAGERVLYSFGPFGISLCEGRYSIWKWHKRNVTAIELTNRRIRGVANTSPGLGKLRPALGSPAFEIPYDSVVSLELYRHPSPVALQEVLTIRYRLGGVIREKSIAMFRHELHEAYGIMQRFVPPGALGLSGGDQV